LLPEGFIGFANLSLRLRVLEKELNLEKGEFYWLNNNRSIVNPLWDFLKAQELANNDMEEAKRFAVEIIDQMILNPGLKIDISSSFKSPYNIDRTAINALTPEGAKFNSIYLSLTKSPEYQKLFVGLFGNNNRFNAKFEIAEHVYEDNDPTKKEVNATTSQDPVTKNIIIKINKQILIAGTGRSQTNIENAKTILHESIHAYLFIKANNPTVGMDIAGILNKMYPTANEQHDFMYTKMIPTMQKVLGEIRDLATVTTPFARSEVESLTMHPTRTPLTSAPWSWNEYYRYLSLKGLDETSCFKEDFPKDSNMYDFLHEYNNQGHRYLKEL
ncbi:hypothetical protein, partial [Flavobacterium sp. ZT3R18]|uniref:hypothetical protein n=1 Tax=Flavobacterium sp. ZT3R18 TaxID=2594429 RepID=UPI00163DD159